MTLRTSSARRPALALAASLALLALPGAASAQQAVGTAAAVNPRSTGDGARVLQLGSRIIHNERISTSDTGSVQVVFVDKTTLSIGPSSSLVIDKFVYDPSTKAGSMAVSLSKGAMRFVGGNASHTGGAEVKTPVATVGIRGAVASVTHRGGQTRAILQFGTMTVTDLAGESVIVRRPGFMVTVGREGIQGPNRVPQGEMDNLVSELRSQGRQNGGRPEPTPDVTGLDQAASHPCTPPAQGQTTFDLAAATCNHVNTASERVADTIAQQASQQGQDNAVIPIIPDQGGGEGGGDYPTFNEGPGIMPPGRFGGGFPNGGVGGFPGGDQPSGR